MIPYCLIVVDMQSKFEASNNPDTIKNCVKEIKKAVKNNMPIIILEYDGFGPTQHALMNSMRNYPKRYWYEKCTDSGADEVHYIVKRFRLSKNLKVVGVNTDACVRDTIYDLACKPKRYRNYKIEVISKACNTESGPRYHLKTLERFAGWENVSVK
jgi:nicotinamidase-related amidase